MHECGDHGTLRDDHGDPKVYRVLHPTLPSVPLAESQIWPSDLLFVNVMRDGRVEQMKPSAGQRSSAEFYAQRVETYATKRLGFMFCSGDHADSTKACSLCGAVR